MVEMEKEVRPMSETPHEALRTIYEHRLEYDKDVPFEDYVKRYNFIVVDGPAYVTNDETWRITLYKQALFGSFKMAVIPDAIVMEGKLLKNRFGYNE